MARRLVFKDRKNKNMKMQTWFRTLRWSGMIVLASFLSSGILVHAQNAPRSKGGIVVFWQAGFPTLESQPVTRGDINAALAGLPVRYVNLGQLQKFAQWRGARLLILPYGSAVPAAAWPAILAYLRQGGNLLTLGGRGLMMPVDGQTAPFLARRAEDAYAWALGFGNSYAARLSPAKLQFRWSRHAASFHGLSMNPRRVFVLERAWGYASYHGLGFMETAGGARAAAPVTRIDFDNTAGGMAGDRCVFLNFTPAPGFWASASGRRLVREAALYARRGATVFEARMQLDTVTPGETPEVKLRFRRILDQRLRIPSRRNQFQVSVWRKGRRLAMRNLQCSGATCDLHLALPAAAAPGFYRVRAGYWHHGRILEAENLGYWVRDPRLLDSGAALTAGRNFLQAHGRTFLPVGANYFSTAWYYGGFGQGNAADWRRDMMAMRRRGINFIRTGVWGGQSRFLNPLGGANQAFLRGLEAFLLAAARAHIQVNFTFTAFNPRIGYGPAHPGGRNPYLDPGAIRAELDYYLSIVRRFKSVPFLSWDLINEPSFSNPLIPWKGNIPNGDPIELRLWRQWLRHRYGHLANLARAWNTTAAALGSWNAIALPSAADITKLTRYGNPEQDRAFDYNLFAQKMFGRWARTMIAAIRAAGSRQLIDVGQDEGGVTNRVLDQFIGGDGVNFTVDHTYWQDNALLWDSLASHRPGKPDFVGETGVQPVWEINNSERWNEYTAAGLIERKLALGLAAGSSGGLLWEWGNGDNFGIQRQDGSNKVWKHILTGIARFARRTAPGWQGEVLPRTAIVLPQSLQFSVFNRYALRAQQHAVRALYDYARGTAYAVGEYQLALLGQPRLIIVPSPWVLSRPAWKILLAHVRAGATLLISGRFDLDAHFHSTGRQTAIGLNYRPRLLAQRMFHIRWAGHSAWLSYPGEETNYLEYGALPGGRSFQDLPLGRGRILYFAAPLELNSSYRAIGEIYRYALHVAGIQPEYTTTTRDPGITICPTRFAQGTLYVLTSESARTRLVSWRDRASGRAFSLRLAPGRAALLWVSLQGKVPAHYGGAILHATGKPSRN